ncbi:MAG: NTP transferase domain-containing protein [Nitrososphaerota archaeon]
MALPVRAVVMAGGRATRMGRVEKQMVNILGRPMIKYVIDALKFCEFIEGIDFVTSLFTPNTNRYLEEEGFRPIVASGSGYISDLREYLVRAEEGLYVVVSSDIPTLRPKHIETVLRLSLVHQEEYLVFTIPYDMVKGLSSSPTIIDVDGRQYQPSGLRVIRKLSGTNLKLLAPLYIPLVFRELGINVNTFEDVKRAELYLMGLEK